MGSHIIGGEFQSDKYPTCPRGKVPLSVKDKTAQDLLWEYAQRRRKVDAGFASDLETALTAAEYVHGAADPTDHELSDLTEEALHYAAAADNHHEVSLALHKAMARELINLRAAEAIDADRVRSVVRAAALALLDERKLYVVRPEPPSMSAIALEAYGWGKACDAVALQGDDLELLLAELAELVARLLGNPDSSGR